MNGKLFKHILETVSAKELKKEFPSYQVSDQLYGNYPANGMSFIGTKAQIFWIEGELRSHDEIAEAYYIHEVGVHGVNGVRGVMYPPNSTYDDLKTWKLFLSGDQFPDWLDPRELERRARAILPKWHSKTFGE